MPKSNCSKKMNLLLWVLIITALLFYSYLFFTQKESYDGDEIWSYGLANSYYNPFLHNSGTWDTNKDSRYLQNFETWITGETFHNYITVQENERFTYDSVWYNQSADVHPPFYYAILHTICSLFPDQFSPWFGLLINYISFAIVMYVLYKLACQYASPAFAFILCGFYAFSAGAEDTYTFIRMYALAATLAILLFQQMQHYLSDNRKKHLLCLFCITVFSCLTHYYLIVYAFFLTAITELYLLLKKRWKNFWSLGITMLTGVLLSVLIFPSMLYHLVYRSGDLSELNLSFAFQGKLIISLLMQQFMGISFPSHKTMFSFYLITLLIVVTIVLLLLFFIFRREHLAAKFIKKTYHCIRIIYKKYKEFMLSVPLSVHLLNLTLLCIYLFYVNNLPIASMKTGAVRYFFPFYPLLCFSLGITLKNVLSTLISNRRYRFCSGFVFLLICTICSNTLTSHCFLYTENPQSGKSISDLPDDGYYIVTATLPHAINNFAVELKDKQYAYFLEEKDFTSKGFSETLQQLPNESSDRPVYLLFTDIEISSDAEGSQKVKDEWLLHFSSLPYATKFEMVGQDVVNGYSILIYQLR